MYYSTHQILLSVIMPGGVKDVGVGVQATKKVETAAAERLLKSDDELLIKHYPRYFYDKREKIFPVDLNK